MPCSQRVCAGWRSRTRPRHGTQSSPHSGYYFTNGLGWFYRPFDTALGILATPAADLDTPLMHLTRAVEQCDTIASPAWGAIARLELATAARARGASGDEEVASHAIAQARSAITDLAMPGWLPRLERLDAGDLQPGESEPAEATRCPRTRDPISRAWVSPNAGSETR